MKTLLSIVKLPYTAVRFSLGGRRPADARGEPALEPGATRRTRGWVRKGAVTFGAVSVVAGAGIFTFGVINSLAPGAEAPGEHDGVVLAYRDDPGAVYDRPIVVTPAPTPVPQETPMPGAIFGAPAPPRESRYRMVIDRIGVNAGVFTYGLDANAVPEVPLNAWDVAWYNFSAPPGTGSNAVFAGHVTWNGRAVFWDLPTLVPGDQVRLIANDGSELVYAVTESYLIDPDAPDAISVMYGTPEDVMTIITCDGDPFFIGGSFGYDYTHRRVIRASLVNVRSAIVAEPPAEPAPAEPASVEPAAVAPPTEAPPESGG